MHERRVVITGIGCVTSLGDDPEQVWQSVINAKSGITPITKFDSSQYTSQIGGQIHPWTGGKHLDKAAGKRIDPFGQYAINAAIDAVADSGLDVDSLDPWKWGVIIGSGVGGLLSMAEGQTTLDSRGPSRVSPFMVPKLMGNAASGHVSIHFGIKGPNYSIASACASAAHSIGDATNLIRQGVTDVMIAGGSEAGLTPLGLACFASLRALSLRNDDPTAASRPWDQDRDGFVLSEGAGVMVIEEYEYAKARGANILAEITGWSQTADAGHITAPHEDGSGAAQAMTQAIADAGLSPDDIDYINAHGTSTGLGDMAEIAAIRKTFGQDTNIPISSTKSVTGHLLGATGGIEAIFCAQAMRDNVIPPTANLDNPAEQCAGLDLVPKQAKEAELKHVLTNSFGFGGHNVALVLSKV